LYIEEFFNEINHAIYDKNIGKCGERSNQSAVSVVAITYQTIGLNIKYKEWEYFKNYVSLKPISTYFCIMKA